MVGRLSLALAAILAIGACSPRPRTLSPLDQAKLQYEACLDDGRDCARERERLGYQIELEKLRLQREQAGAASAAATAAQQRNTMAIFSTFAGPVGYTGGW